MIKRKNAEKNIIYSIFIAAIIMRIFLNRPCFSVFFSLFKFGGNSRKWEFLLPLCYDSRRCYKITR